MPSDEVVEVVMRRARTQEEADEMVKYLECAEREFGVTHEPYYARAGQFTGIQTSFAGQPVAQLFPRVRAQFEGREVAAASSRLGPGFTPGNGSNRLLLDIDGFSSEAAITALALVLGRAATSILLAPPAAISRATGSKPSLGA